MFGHLVQYSSTLYTWQAPVAVMCLLLEHLRSPYTDTHQLEQCTDYCRTLLAVEQC